MIVFCERPFHCAAIRPPAPFCKTPTLAVWALLLCLEQRSLISVTCRHCLVKRSASQDPLALRQGAHLENQPHASYHAESSNRLACLPVRNRLNDSVMQGRSSPVFSLLITWLFSMLLGFHEKGRRGRVSTRDTLHDHSCLLAVASVVASSVSAVLSWLPRGRMRLKRLQESQFISRQLDGIDCRLAPLCVAFPV